VKKEKKKEKREPTKKGREYMYGRGLKLSFRSILDTMY
jgi:hypothetical protein